MNTSDNMYGVAKGVLLCNIEKNQELNDRLYARNIPSQPLQPEFSMRPTPTKYSLFPMVDLNSQDNKVKMNPYETYSPEKVFNPGNASAPWSGFSSSINTESQLRNQFFALQSCDQAKYIPPSTSELYNPQTWKTMKLSLL